MSKVYDGIDEHMAAWIESQPVFFVATAPLDGDGLVNLSPKGTIGDDERIAAYHAEKNATSLDGLPGLSGSSESPVAREDPVAPAGRR